MAPLHQANFHTVYCDPQEVIIRDVGPWHRHPTVTNEAEGVVSRLYHNGLLRPGQKLFYFDSDDGFDELRHDGQGKFLGFAPAPANHWGMTLTDKRTILYTPAPPIQQGRPRLRYKDCPEVKS